MSLNLYTCCANNPIIYNDPDGHSFKLLSNLGKSLYNFGKKAVNTVVNTSKSIINKANNVGVSIVNKTSQSWNDIKQGAKSVLDYGSKKIQEIKNSYVGIKEKAENVVSTLKKSKTVNQVVLGNYTEDVTLLGTGIQVATGIAGVDLPMDIRDISADFVKWEWSWGQVGKTAEDLLAVLPIVGLLKYGDEAASIVKNSDEVLGVFKKSDNAIKGVSKAEPFDIVKYSDKTPGLENHHGVMDMWSQKNISGYKLRPADSTAIALTQEQHNATRSVFGKWKYENYGFKGKIDWENVSPSEIQMLSERMFDAAKVPQNARAEYYREFNKYIYGLEK